MLCSLQFFSTQFRPFQSVVMLGLSSTQEYLERACLSKAFATLVEECGIVERREAETEPLAHLDKEPAWAQDRTAVRDFLQAPCGCGRNCTSQITEEELLNSRHDFGMLSWREKNCVVLSQLQAFQDAAPVARSARASKVRERQKFHYQLSFNRPVCRQVFLFYHGETPRRLESLQRHLRLVGTIPPMAIAQKSPCRPILLEFGELQVCLQSLNLSALASLDQMSHVRHFSAHRVSFAQLRHMVPVVSDSAVRGYFRTGYRC